MKSLMFGIYWLFWVLLSICVSFAIGWWAFPIGFMGWSMSAEALVKKF